MARYVVIIDGVVDNIVEWDGNTEVEDGGWAPPDGTLLIANDEAQIGWAYGEGGFTPPAPPVPTVPASVTPRQLKLALLGAGLLDDIDAFVASPAVPRPAQISWEYATEYRRDDPMLNMMAGMLVPPMTAQQIDQLFVAAAGI